LEGATAWRTRGFVAKEDAVVGAVMSAEVKGKVFEEIDRWLVSVTVNDRIQLFYPPSTILSSLTRDCWPPLRPVGNLRQSNPITRRTTPVMSTWHKKCYSFKIYFLILKGF
jgi:hypothetical protein